MPRRMPADCNILADCSSFPQGSHIFVINNFMKPKEAAHYITESEKQGYGSLAKEYPQKYRNNDRLLSLNTNMAQQVARSLLGCTSIVRPIFQLYRRLLEQFRTVSTFRLACSLFIV
jgi:purine nucleoside permease